jgi:hypothetical protein
MERPALEKTLDAATFKKYYYLKEELVSFCRRNALPASGGKQELTERIVVFLESGKILPPRKKEVRSHTSGIIDADTIIEENVVCSENLRAFFKEQIGKSFSFNTTFQTWLKENSGRTYGEAVEAYRRTAKVKKETKGEIGRQFEYNTYIRDFFQDNPGLSLEDAILCWKTKKTESGPHRYEKTDLDALNS